MWWIRSLGYIIPPLCVALVLAFAGAIAPQPLPATQIPQAAKPAATSVILPVDPKADDNAVKTWNAAIDLLDPKKMGWVETTLWQKVDTQGLGYQAEGRYLAGPKHRLRLDLIVTLGKTRGETTVVSDGLTVWNSTKIGPGAAVVTRWDLKKINDILNSPGTLPQWRDQFYRSQHFAGLAPLLQSLQQQMVFTKQETDRWQNHEVFKLTGVWSSEIVKAVAPPPNPWPLSVPRTCRCYLDKKTFWPVRLEWWGPAGPDGADSLLTQMEFRNPKFLKGDDLPTEMAKAFSFDPGKTKVIDRTQEIADRIIRDRSQQPPVPSRASAPGAGPGSGIPK